MQKFFCRRPPFLIPVPAHVGCLPVSQLRAGWMREVLASDLLPQPVHSFYSYKSCWIDQSETASESRTVHPLHSISFLPGEFVLSECLTVEKMTRNFGYSAASSLSPHDALFRIRFRCFIRVSNPGIPEYGFRGLSWRNSPPPIFRRFWKKIGK